MLGKTQQLIPNTLELMAELEEQQKSGSVIRVDTAEQAVVDGAVPMTAVDEKVIQQDTEHHDNMEKRKVGLARTGTHRRALATVTQARR